MSRDAADQGAGWGRWLVSAAVLAAVVGGAWVEGSRCRAWFVRRAAERAFHAGDIEGALSRYETVKRLLPDEPASYTDPADSIARFMAVDPETTLTLDAIEQLAVRATHDYLVAIGKGPPGAWAYAGLGSMIRSLRAVRIRDEGLDLSGVAEDPLTDLRPEDRLFEAALVKAVQIEPRNFYYRDFLGDFYLRRGFEERALAHIRVATRLHPVLDRHFYLSYLVTVSPAVLTAVEQGVRQALESDDTQVSAYDIHRFLAEIHMRMGRLDRAMASLEAAAEVAPYPYTVDIQIGQLLAREGDDEGALEAFRRAAERKPDYHRAWLHLGLTQSRLGRHDDAVEAALRARGLLPTDFTTAWALADVLEAAGRLDDAAELLETLTRTYEDKQHSYLQLIRIYEKQGRVAYALRVARRLAARFPDEAVFQQQLDQLQRAVESDR